MLNDKGPSVPKNFRPKGLQMVSIHHHTTGVQPGVIFPDYYGIGPADRLAKSASAAGLFCVRSLASHARLAVEPELRPFNPE